MQLYTNFIYFQFEKGTKMVKIFELLIHEAFEAQLAKLLKFKTRSLWSKIHEAFVSHFAMFLNLDSSRF